MVAIPYTVGLHRLTPNTYAYLQPVGSWGQSNCGLVTSQGEAVLIDTQFTVPLTRKLLDTVSAALPQITISTVINTHADGDHCWGNGLFPYAVIIGSEPTRRHIANGISPNELVELIASAPPETPFGTYMRRYFGAFDFSSVTVKLPTRTFTDELELKVGVGTDIKLTQVGPAHTDGDVIVHVTDEGVLFAGDILFIGVHPIVWSGPVDNWVTACTRILESGAKTIVPGHGPITDPAGVTRFRDYLEYVREQAVIRYNLGMPYWQAALDIPMMYYADWWHRERLVITVAAIYRELGLDEPLDIPTVMTLTARAFCDLDASCEPDVLLTN
jgi:cyclase